MAEHDSRHEAHSTSVNEHLSYPSTSAAPEPPPPSTQQARQVSKDRLYIGNLHPTVDEYALLQVFSKFGKITKLDFLFHKSGALKGKPRGYAFIEYSSSDEALKALTAAHDKLLRGRKLVVTFAHQAPQDLLSHGGASSRLRKGMMETGRPTALSLIKSSATSRREATEDKIAMMEAKLRQMESSKSKYRESAGSSSTSSMPTHPSLPAKPPPAISPHLASTLPVQQHRSHGAKPSKRLLPSLPLIAPSSTPRLGTSESKPNAIPSSRTTKPKLVGVKIGKAKDKQASPQEDSASS